MEADPVNIRGLAVHGVYRTVAERHCRGVTVDLTTVAIPEHDLMLGIPRLTVIAADAGKQPGLWKSTPSRLGAATVFGQKNPPSCLSLHSALFRASSHHHRSAATSQEGPRIQNAALACTILSAIASVFKWRRVVRSQISLLGTAFQRFDASQLLIAFNGSHVGHDCLRLTFFRTSRAAFLALSSLAGISVPVPKYV